MCTVRNAGWMKGRKVEQRESRPERVSIWEIYRHNTSKMVSLQLTVTRWWCVVIWGKAWDRPVVVKSKSNVYSKEGKREGNKEPGRDSIKGKMWITVFCSLLFYGLRHHETRLPSYLWMGETNDNWSKLQLGWAHTYTNTLPLEEYNWLQCTNN